MNPQFFITDSTAGEKQEKQTSVCLSVKLFYQFKADVTPVYRKCISDVEVSIVSLIKRQVIHLTWRLLDQCSTCSRLIPLNKMAVLIRIGGSPSGWIKDREKGCPSVFESLRYWEAVWAGDASSMLLSVDRIFLGGGVRKIGGLEAEKEGGCATFSQSRRVIEPRFRWAVFKVMVNRGLEGKYRSATQAWEGKSLWQIYRRGCAGSLEI